MKQLLIEHARRRNAEKRPDPRKRVLLDDMADAFESSEKVALLDLDTALDELRQRSDRQYEVVILRYFVGLSWEDIARDLGVSVSTAEKDWQAARAWLRVRLNGRFG